MKDVLVGWFDWRIKKNKNAIVVINGSTGSGKTYAGLRLGYDISQSNDTHFTLQDNVSFDFVSLLKNTRKPQNTKPGTVFLFEEVGAMGGGAASREWQSKTKRFFFSFMQTTRHRNQILIFTCPHFSFLDSGARSLVHMQLITHGIDFKNKVCHVKPYVLQVNNRTGKIYFKMLRFMIDESRTKLTEYSVKYPPEDMVKEYEKVKEAYTDKLNQTIIDDEVKVKKKDKIHVKIQPERLKELINQGLTNNQMAVMLGVSESTIKNHKRGLVIG